MKKPVNVGIPYTNDQERKWAIAQAERYGYKKGINWVVTQGYNAGIYLHADGFWYDVILRRNEDTIPLERPEEENYIKTNGTPLPESEKLTNETRVIIGKYTRHNFEAFPDVQKVAIPECGTFLNIDPEKYERMDKEDGTIVLKPKKKKVKFWIEVYEFEGGIHTYKHNSEASLRESIEEGKEDGETLLEVIEREYEL